MLLGFTVLLGLAGCPKDASTGGDTHATQDIAIPSCEGDVLDALTTADAPGSGSEAYAVPGENELAAFDEALTASLTGDWEAALAAAEVSGYRLCLGQADQADLVLWLPLDQSTGRAQLVFRTGLASPLILGTPHPNYEGGTLEEGVEIFRVTSARALIVSGTHRCANTAPSGCDGSTSVCTEESDAYRESDQAHVVISFYHRAHVVLSDIHGTDTVISLHGMVRDGISLSNGTDDPVADTSPVAQLAGVLVTAFPGEQVTTCNTYEDSLTEVHLCGSTNTQGRHLNGSDEVCTERATEGSGRFIHTEQNRAIRVRPDEVATAFVAWLESF